MTGSKTKFESPKLLRAENTKRGDEMSKGTDEKEDGSNAGLNGGWLITIFWEAHRGDDGCSYPGGYETYPTRDNPIDYMTEDIKKYGHIVKLINSEPMTEEQFNKFVAI